MDGMAVAVVEGGQVYFVRTDHIGRPVFATDTAGTKIWEAEYLPFGGVRTSSGDTIALRFPGQWYQSESALHQNWMRDYDPTTGRYMQADPLGLVDGASVYGYALQSPGRYVDPRGEETIIIISTPRSLGGLGHASLVLPDMIYDPSGNCSCQFDEDGSGPHWPGSGQTYDRNRGTDRAFFAYQFSNPTDFSTRVFIFPTTPAEEERIRENIRQLPPSGLTDCARFVSNAIAGVGPFEGLEPTPWPTRLQNRLIHLNTGTEYVLR